MATPENGGFGCFLLIGVIGTILVWLYQFITWPVRAISRLFTKK